MPQLEYKLRGKVYMWAGPASWFFVNVSKAKAKDIRFYHSQNAAGFGSIAVQVTLGETTWKTSVFPDSKSGTYVLPLKKAVRVAEGVEEGDTVSYQLKIAI